MSLALAPEPLRVALVGLGPKGLFALERLLDRIAAAPATRAVEIDAFEPHPTPGAGPVYEPSQPSYLRMNFAASQVSAWPAASRAGDPAGRRSYEEWRDAQNEELDRDDYPPRADVGRYLAATLLELRRFAPAHVSITIFGEVVSAIRPTGAERWTLETGRFHRPYDEVIVATGHASRWRGALRRGWNHRAALVEAVFPVERTLGESRVPPGVRVAARGFALTFIDAALALSEGRGGIFEPAGPVGKLTYLRSGLEPAVIYPYSRSGRAMLAKPEPGAAGDPDGWELAVVRVAERVRTLPGGLEVRRDLLPVLSTLSGLRGGDPEHAMGAAWRAVYPAIVERFGGDGVPDPEWPAFRALATEMERIAFGPPAVNAAKLDALIEAGLVDLSHARGGSIESTSGRTLIRSARVRDGVDVVIDAVLPPPGVVGLESSLFAQLRADRLVRVQPGRRGIEVGPDATCVDADGRLSSGLAACGRPTEDSVIGNDTLSRNLHPQLELWASRVTAALGVRAAAAVGQP